MLIVGIFFLIIGIVFGVIKYFFIRSAARDLFNGGGAPTLDFAIFIPMFLANGISLLLKHAKHYPFFGFGFLLYLVIAALFFGIMCLEDALGKPIRQQQLADIVAARAKREEHPTGNAQAATPSREDPAS
jgi:hypothetical protein